MVAELVSEAEEPVVAREAEGCGLSRGLMAAPWRHSSVVRAADCRSAGPWFKSGCALL